MTHARAGANLLPGFASPRVIRGVTAIIRGIVVSIAAFIVVVGAMAFGISDLLLGQVTWSKIFPESYQLFTVFSWVPVIGGVQVVLASGAFAWSISAAFSFVQLIMWQWVLSGSGGDWLPESMRLKSWLPGAMLLVFIALDAMFDASGVVVLATQGAMQPSLLGVPPNANWTLFLSAKFVLTAFALVNELVLTWFIFVLSRVAEVGEAQQGVGRSRVAERIPPDIAQRLQPRPQHPGGEG